MIQVILNFFFFLLAFSFIFVCVAVIKTTIYKQIILDFTVFDAAIKKAIIRLSEQAGNRFNQQEVFDQILEFKNLSKALEKQYERFTSPDYAIKFAYFTHTVYNIRQFVNLTDKLKERFDWIEDNYIKNKNNPGIDDVITTFEKH